MRSLRCRAAGVVARYGVGVENVDVPAATGRMRPTAHLINTAGGDPLTAHTRVLVTPHAAWYSEESYETLKTEVAHEVVRVLSGERPRSPLNRPEEA